MLRFTIHMKNKQVECRNVTREDETHVEMERINDYILKKKKAEQMHKRKIKKKKWVSKITRDENIPKYLIE